MESKWLRTDNQCLQSDAFAACLHSLVQQVWLWGKEHWRIYCRYTVKPPDEWERQQGSKDRHFCPFRVEGRGAQGWRLLCIEHHWSKIRPLTWGIWTFHTWMMGRWEIIVETQMWNTQQVNIYKYTLKVLCQCFVKIRINEKNLKCVEWKLEPPSNTLGKSWV